MVSFRVLGMMEMSISLKVRDFKAKGLCMLYLGGSIMIGF